MPAASALSQYQKASFSSNCVPNGSVWCHCRMVPGAVSPSCSSSSAGKCATSLATSYSVLASWSVHLDVIWSPMPRT